jgi:hypothetical protein
MPKVPSPKPVTGPPAPVQSLGDSRRSQNQAARNEPPSRPCTTGAARGGRRPPSTLPAVVANRLPAPLKIQHDWQGRASIPPDAAARLVDELEAERRKQADRSPNAAASLKPRPPPSTSRGAHVTINPSSSPGNSERPPTVGGSYLA